MKKRDCANCPLVWEMRYAEDSDCGCYFYNDLWQDRVVCFLPSFIKNFIMKKLEKKISKENTDFLIFVEERNRKMIAVEKALRETILNKRCLCIKTEDGCLIELDTEMVIKQEGYQLLDKYEDLLK